MPYNASHVGLLYFFILHIFIEQLLGLGIVFHVEDKGVLFPGGLHSDAKTDNKEVTKKN